MAFDSILKALRTQLRDYSGLSYVDDNDVYVGYSGAIPKTARCAIIIEPAEEEESEWSSGIISVHYFVQIYLRITHGGDIEEIILTTDEFGKGLLDLVQDIKNAILSDRQLGLETSGTFVSGAGDDKYYNVGPSRRYVAVKVNGFQPVGWNEIDVCGALPYDKNLSGTTIASILQTNLRALDDEANGYGQVTVTYDDNTKKFTLTSAGLTGPESWIDGQFEALSASAHKELKFHQGTVTRGVRISDIKFGTVTAFNDFYPVRYRILPVEIIEERYVL